MKDSVRYAELTPAAFRRRIAQAPIAYLPLGTLEWHGEHLPLGSDGLQAAGFFERLAKKAGGIVLPMLFLGPDMREETDSGVYVGMDILGHPKGEPAQLAGSAYWSPDELFIATLENILAQLSRAGFKVVMAHGHGPSNHYFKKNISAWEEKYGLKLMNCYRDDIDGEVGLQTDHAAANETSCMLNFYPELVHMENLNSDPGVWPLAVSGQDPRVHASAERGKRSEEFLLEYFSKELASILAAL